jgi:hypothetical protein
MKVSGFTFAHNALSGGLPVIEAVTAVRPFVDEILAVDIESTDGTKEVLTKLCEKVLTSPWNGRDTTPNAYLKHVECKGDVIIFFEADEVYDESLLKEVQFYLARGFINLAVWRIQLEQNFQRCRQYPIPVHRIFPKGGGTYRIHPTIWPENMRASIEIIPSEFGYLWDCSNIFKEQWLQRKATQAEIWGPPRHLMVAEHFTQSSEISEEEELARLNEPHWEYKSSPFKIPKILLPLVGQTKYKVEI